MLIICFLRLLVVFVKVLIEKDEPKDWFWQHGNHGFVKAQNLLYPDIPNAIFRQEGIKESLLSLSACYRARKVRLTGSDSSSHHPFH